MAWPHVASLPDSMQTGQHSPAGVTGTWQCVVGQATSSHTARPPLHRHVTHGSGDQTAWGNMTKRWFEAPPPALTPPFNTGPGAEDFLTRGFPWCSPGSLGSPGPGTSLSSRGLERPALARRGPATHGHMGDGGF
ncbi:hypothetical protein EYF80_029064 [Liparis tanakae]|uniref:Uncharacterized protein n=1 Tax=Liparis tanakae TaxID=230148 RepID=A0A4Z2H5F6_9TELE|nr:hypothetical protein EYF80_029064 [Liparis tanakae]